MTTLRFRDVDRAFGRHHTLAAVSMEFSRREIVVVVGPSGAGKETILQLASGLEVPDRGEVSVAGAELHSGRADGASEIAVVFGLDDLVLRHTVSANLRFWARLHGLDRGRSAERAETLLAAFGLEDHRRDRVGSLTRVAAIRVAIACRIIHQPAILLLDNPCDRMSSAQTAELADDFVRLSKDEGLGVVWVTPRPGDARHADRLVVMRAGTVRFSGTPREAMTAAGTDEIAAAVTALTGENAPQL